uniref:Peptidyl-prolyl cis-trans isomerase n=1 Tax=Entomoneis paludosa TaxID=265537 RepID=A0A7S3DVB8_9STRA|mmetsp:Transcript_40251/g.83837  ORF Transcript_40251/g.83837 Transcript_40251/m.83837 type:complete len:159 (+) Transcript_40251:121-597(+)|eukprot:CAMPEP_0172445378 /NCGR_PEP_ID=MMETSP1065-20121228/5208_1 /TAXON_ID=265537 /ORGANISM="Amphiprora paludosa, Strain CCMP125" /LENGTH=158 /DNA_ID=CAMNT_0013196189 /DNA_START=41 /DNA_END=517 /DNA_ORIENTATION=-
MKSIMHLLLLALAFLASTLNVAIAFAVVPNGGRINDSSLQMGMFDGIMKAFANEEFAAPPEGIRATARHILVKSSEEVDMVLDQLEGGASFSSVASDYSTCPSGKQGGSLGSFRPGTMVPEFDNVIFNPDTAIGSVVGPVETKFGYHLIVVDKRTGIE